MEVESLRWVLIVAGVLVVLGIYGYSRELKKDQEKTPFTKQDDLFEEVPEIDPLFDDVPDLPEDIKIQATPLIDMNRDEVDESIVFHLFAQEDEIFTGEALQKVFDNFKLQRTTNHFFGLVDQFHPLYQVSSSFKPGYFPEHSLDEFETKGLTFFMTLPTQNPKDNFEKLLLDLHNIAQKLDGRILDEDRNDLSQQMLNHLREKIISYSMKH